MWEIKDHSQFDKRFVIDGPLPLIIDNDDVNAPGVAILAEEVVRVLNEHFVTQYRRQCQNEDCDEFWEYQGSLQVCPRCGELTRLTEVFAS